MQKYLQRASDAETQARYARSPSERQTLLEIAALWRRLAEYELRRDDLRPGSTDGPAS